MIAFRGIGCSLSTAAKPLQLQLQPRQSLLQKTLRSIMGTSVSSSASTSARHNGCTTSSRSSSSSSSPLLQRRALMTEAVEPPPHVTESPLSVVLAEDEGFYPSSWHEAFTTQIPEQYGMSFRQFSFGPDTSTYDAALQEIKRDLSTPHHDGANTILVTRGPWMSWMASFYLESLPLAGLVMVDPMQLDDMNGINQFVLQYEKLGLQNSQQYKMYQEYAEHWDHWTLKLEPGAVPMMVMYTNVRPGYKRCAENTAIRHGGEDVVPVVKMPSTSRTHVKDCIGEIDAWIHANAL